jgi:hypothetical protein
MRFLNTFESFEIDTDYDLIDNLKESLSMWHDVLLASIGAQEVNMVDELQMSNNMELSDLNKLSNNTEFLKSLSSIGLKKSSVEETDNYETFINKPCKFMLIYKVEASELETPEYILFQTWDEGSKKWENSKLYKIDGNINEFYDKLTSRTIEIIDGEDNFIYNTSNGNDWMLQNTQNENDVYKKSFRKEEFEELIDRKGLKLNII